MFLPCAKLHFPLINFPFDQNELSKRGNKHLYFILETFEREWIHQYSFDCTKIKVWNHAIWVPANLASYIISKMGFNKYNFFFPKVIFISLLKPFFCRMFKRFGKKQKASGTEIKIVSCLVIVQNHFVDICRPWLEEVELVQNQHW